MLVLVGALLATCPLECPCAHMVGKCVGHFFRDKGNIMISFDLLKDIVLSRNCNYSSYSLLGSFCK
jgi:hypothetical protein